MLGEDRRKSNGRKGRPVKGSRELIRVAAGSGGTDIGKLSQVVVVEECV